MNISTRQWEILAADAGPDVIYKGIIKIQQITFTDYAAETDAFVITDRDGNLVWSGNGHSDLSPLDSGHEIGQVNGLIVPTLDSGRLIIYTE